LGHDLDHGADRRTLFAYAVEELLEQRFNARVGAEERAFYDVLPVPLGAVDLVRPDLDQCAAHHHARHDFASNRAGRDARRGFARGLAAAAAVVAYSVFGVVGVISVPRPVSILDL